MESSCCHSNRWDEIVTTIVTRLQEEVPEPSERMTVDPITTEQWLAAVRPKKATTATGLNGVSRNDFLRMPAHLVSAMVDCVNRCDVGTQGWPVEALTGHITAVERLTSLRLQKVSVRSQC